MKLDRATAPSVGSLRPPAACARKTARRFGAGPACGATIRLVTIATMNEQVPCCRSNSLPLDLAWTRTAKVGMLRSSACTCIGSICVRTTTFPVLDEQRVLPGDVDINWTYGIHFNPTGSAKSASRRAGAPQNLSSSCGGMGPGSTRRRRRGAHRSAIVAARFTARHRVADLLRRFSRARATIWKPVRQ